jgi:hypothetical protein
VPANIPWIEHVLPQNPDESWDGIFDKDQRSKMTNLWANLIPLSAQMNGDLSNSGYPTKRPIYQADAMFTSARRFAESYSDWSAPQLEDRSERLVAWALKRWPG